MLIFNVTTKINSSIEKEWLKWLKEEYNPAIIQTGCFSHAIVFHLSELNDEEGITYAVQYHATNEDAYRRYLKLYDSSMQKLAMDKWGNQYISFRTLMKAVN